jgi:DNA-binding NtrC family response regulator
MVYENRWLCHRHEYLHFELKNLEVDSVKGKIEHPDKVKDVLLLKDGSVKDVVLTGSKDLSDCVVASVINAALSQKTPVDVAKMKEIMRKSMASSEAEAEKHKYWWAFDERTGKPVVGTSDDMNKFKNLLKKQL